jgi:hypothetical protein
MSAASKDVDQSEMWCLWSDGQPQAFFDDEIRCTLQWTPELEIKEYLCLGHRLFISVTQTQYGIQWGVIALRSTPQYIISMIDHFVKDGHHDNMDLSVYLTKVFGD